MTEKFTEKDFNTIADKINAVATNYDSREEMLEDLRGYSVDSDTAKFMMLSLGYERETLLEIVLRIEHNIAQNYILEKRVGSLGSLQDYLAEWVGLANNSDDLVILQVGENEFWTEK